MIKHVLIPLCAALATLSGVPLASAQEVPVLTQEVPKASWKGKTLRRSVSSPGRCSARSCSSFGFEVGDDMSSVDVRIRWRSRRNNLDLYVLREGEIVGRSRKRRSRSERVRLPDAASGTYDVLVVPRRVKRTRYRGVALLLPPPPVDLNGLIKDCSRDVTKALKQLIAATPDGGTITFDPDGCYRIDQPVRIADRFGLTLEGNGATFKATTPGDQDRRHFWFFGGGDLTIRNLTVRGANPHAGVGDDAYRPGKAFQHAFALQGVSGALIENVQAYDVYGDFVYIGADARVSGAKPWSKNIMVRGSHFERNGRQGISIVAGEDVTITGNEMLQVRWAMFDLEPNGMQGGARRVLIEGNRTGKGRLLWLASKGKGFKVNDITIRNNEMRVRTGTPIIEIKTPEGGTRGPISIEDNTLIVGGSPHAGIELIRCVGVRVTGNVATYPDYRAMTAVKLGGSPGAVVTGNRFINARQVVEAINSPDLVESDNLLS